MGTVDDDPHHQITFKSSPGFDTRKGEDARPVFLPGFSGAGWAVPYEWSGNQYSILPMIDELTMLGDLHFQYVFVNFFNADFTVINYSSNSFMPPSLFLCVRALRMVWLAILPSSVFTKSSSSISKSSTCRIDRIFCLVLRLLSSCSLV